MSKNLANANVDFVVCACNTAHAFKKQMIEGCGEDVPFVSMIDVTCNQVVKNIEAKGGARKCGILGGGGCITANLFQDSLNARDIEPIVPSA